MTQSGPGKDFYTDKLNAFLKRYHIWDRDYVLEGIFDLMDNDDLTGAEKIVLVKMIRQAHQDATEGM